jgi:hypothetical protein
MSLLASVPAFAECEYVLKCSNSDKSVLFEHVGSEGGEPYTDDSTLTLQGKMMKLPGNQFDEAADTNKSGDFVWSEISEVPNTSVYALTPTRGDGQVALAVIENRSTRTKVIKKNGGISEESFKFKGTLVMHSAAGVGSSIAIPERKLPVSCSNSTACD